MDKSSYVDSEAYYNHGGINGASCDAEPEIDSETNNEYGDIHTWFVVSYLSLSYTIKMHADLDKIMDVISMDQGDT